MVDLIGTLGTQQRLIEEAIGRLEAALERGQALRARAALNELQNTVTAHFGLEEVELYSLLEHALPADSDSPDAQKVRSSRTGLEDARRALDAFFARTSDAELPLEDVATAWHAVAGTLHARLAAQRDAYPEFRRLTRLQRFGAQRRPAQTVPLARPA